MSELNLTPSQREAVAAGGSNLLVGPAGAGKTTVLRRRLVELLRGGEPAYSILILATEPEHLEAFIGAIQQSGVGPYSGLTATTFTRLSQDMVSLFWPLVARDAGFARPYQPPSYLSYDMAQVLMWRIVDPMLDAGAFADLRLRPQQIVSQILDTLNRAALNGLTLDEAIERQMRSWIGEQERLGHLEDAAAAARAFRQTCLSHSLLDQSLTTEVFDRQITGHESFLRYFRERYRHLIVDNIEEQPPAGQAFVARLMNETTSSAIAFDSHGGYKRFLSADPRGAEALRLSAGRVFEFDESFVTRPALKSLANLVENELRHTHLPADDAAAAIADVVSGRYRREMVRALGERLRRLVDEEGVAERDIAIVVPYLDGALRYMLTHTLADFGLRHRILRRRTSPREEPRVRAWLTWLALAHPDWGVRPAAYDVAEALTLSVETIDPARAQLLTGALYRPEIPALLPIDELPVKIAARVGSERLALYETLRGWLEANGGRDSIDRFLHRLFSELLTRPAFQPVPDVAGAAVVDWLARAAARLRRSAAALGLDTPAEIGATFITAINQGLVAANPPDWGAPPDPDGIGIGTIYAYLLGGEPARYQVWLEASAPGWWDIPRQPLSNAFVLARGRAADAPWTTEEDFAMRNELLARIVQGLTDRAADGIILAVSELDRRGQRQDGALWRALGPAVREWSVSAASADSGDGGEPE